MNKEEVEKVLEEYIQTSKKLQQELEQKNKIIEEIKTTIKNYKNFCRCHGVYMNLTVSMIENLIIKGDTNE